MPRTLRRSATSLAKTVPGSGSSTDVRLPLIFGRGCGFLATNAHRLADMRSVARPRIRLARTTAGEEEVQAIREVLLSGVLTNGPRTVAFEQEFARRHEVAHAVAFANGTVALAAMYLALGIGPGDEVIVPSMTFISSATSVVHVGATPVFADVNPRTFNLSPDSVRQVLSRRTKAVLAVHYAGQPAAMDELQQVCDEAGVVLLEDAAQAVGAMYLGRPAGSLGRMAMFSFTPTKNITMGEGGLVTTDDAHLAEQLRLLRNHGQTALYKHEVLGWNWRITEMQAAMGVVQLGRLDTILANKRRNATWMSARLKDVQGVTPPWADPRAESVHMLYTCLVDSDRDNILGGMNDAGIESRLYFPPVHRQAVFAGNTAVLPVTDYLAEHMLSIPMHSQLSDGDLEDIASTLAKFVAAT
jgi:perosamine synthetase